MTLTDQELAELERLHQAATPGEWDVEAEPEDMQSWYICHPATVCTVTTVCQIENEPNVAAIVAAHNALPALIAEIRRLRALALDLDAAATLGAALGEDGEAWRSVRDRIAVTRAEVDRPIRSPDNRFRLSGGGS